MSLLGLITGAASAILPAIAARKRNQEQKQFTLDMYNRQRQDVLADWKRQNDYNSPLQQMQRLKEAGLNPNLVYDKGATAMGGEIGKVSPQSYNPEASVVQTERIPEVLSAFQDYENKKLQTNNLEQQIKIAEAQEQYIKANTLRVFKDTDRMSFNLFKDNELFPYQQDMLKENILGKRAQTAYTYGENERRWLENSPRIDETLARIAKLQADTSKVPFEKEILRKTADKLQSENYWRDISEGQKRNINDVLHESMLWDVLLKQRNVKDVDLKMETEKMRQKFKNLGLSETVTSDLIFTILKLAK